MIYIKSIAGAQTTFIPRNGEDASGAMTLVLRNTIDQEETIIQLSDVSPFGNYFEVSVSIPEDTDEGEHQYKLIQGEKVLSNGLIYIGELTKPDEYENTITYRQYGTE